MLAYFLALFSWRNCANGMATTASIAIITANQIIKFACCGNLIRFANGCEKATNMPTPTIEISKIKLREEL